MTLFKNRPVSRAVDYPSEGKSSAGQRYVLSTISPGSHAKGIGMTVIAAALITLNDAAMKAVLHDLPLGQALFLRGIFATLPMMLCVRRVNVTPFLTSGNRLHLAISALLSVLAAACFMASLSRLPLSIAVTTYFTYPLFLVLLGPPLLAEKFSGWALVAAFVGFVGAMLVANPAGTLGWFVLMPLAAALFAALREVIFRHSASKNITLPLLLSSQASIAVFGLVLMDFHWAPVSLTDFLLIAFSAAAFNIGVLLTISAYRYSNLTTVAAFKYSGILWATVIGFMVWGELLSLRQQIGSLLVIMGGLWGLLAVSRQKVPVPRH